MGIAARHKISTEYDLQERIRVLETHYDEVIDEKRAQTH